MLSYIFNRILLFIPTLIVISFISFGLSKATPGDKVTQLVAAENYTSPVEYKQKYIEQAQILGLDKPNFYISLSTSAYPDTLYKYLVKDERENLQALVAQYGNWHFIESYFQQVEQTSLLLDNLPTRSKQHATSLFRSELEMLKVNANHNVIQSIFTRIDTAQVNDSLVIAQLLPQITNIKQKYNDIIANATPYKHYIPSIHWYGFNNQYHQWASNFVVGNWGASSTDRLPVFKKIMNALQWTLGLSFAGVIIAYIFSIFMGVWAAQNNGTKKEQFVTIVLFLIYSMPSFFIASLLIVFFSTPEYGMDLFPSMGVGDTSPNTPFFSKLIDRIWHFILPLFCMTIGAFAFISRQVKAAMLESLESNYIKTARAKGVPKRSVIWKHAFKNSLFPLITMFASVLPGLIGGSIIIEYIFSIPGMGNLMLSSILSQDWNVVYAVLMIGAVLTLLGVLIADILYTYVDPRVKLIKE